MKVLLATPYYWPEDFGAGVSMTELATSLVRRGHGVEVLTLMPNYPKGEVFEAYRGEQSMVETHEGVRIVRQFVRPAARDANVLRKGIAAYKVQSAFLKASSKLTKPDVILTISPPPFAGASAQKMAQKWGVPYVVRVADIASHAIAAAKASRNPAAKLISNLEAKVIKGAAAINTVSASFIPELVRIGHPKSAKEVVYDWADGGAIKPMSDDETFRKEWGLEDKFVLMYSGSLGYTSDLGPVLEAISKMTDRSRLEFVILGAGPKLQEVQDLAKSLVLDNVTFRELVPRSELNRSLCTADLHVATLTPEGAKSSTQGKMRTITAAGRGVIAVMPPECDEASLIRSGEFGEVFDNKDSDRLAARLDDLCANPESGQRLGDSARKFFESNFNLEHCVSQIEDQLLRVIAQP